MSCSSPYPRRRLSLAASLLAAGPAIEPLAYPKPGNTHRFREAPDRRLEHFAVSSIVLSHVLASVAEEWCGGAGRLGYHIYRAVRLARTVHGGGNTCLGTATLLVPLASALHLGWGSVDELPRLASGIVARSSVEDAAWFYRALLAAGPSYLGRLDSEIPDATARGWERLLAERGITLYSLLVKAAEWDPVSREVVSGYPETVWVYRRLRDVWGEAWWNNAVVEVFLDLLSARPDGLIYRKWGGRAARRVVEMARTARRLGAPWTERGRAFLEEMDRAMWSRGWNPGSTADILAAGISLVLLDRCAAEGMCR